MYDNPSVLGGVPIEGNQLRAIGLCGEVRNKLGLSRAPLDGTPVTIYLRVGDTIFILDQAAVHTTDQRLLKGGACVADEVCSLLWESDAFLVFTSILYHVANK